MSPMHSHNIYTCFSKARVPRLLPFSLDLARDFLPFSYTVDCEQSWERLDLEVDLFEQL